MDESRRKIIQGLVSFYKKNLPHEYDQAIARSKKIKNSKANVYGSDIDKEFRHEFSIPAKLYRLIDESLPTPFLKENSEATWFRKEFPEFGGSEKW